MIVIPRRLSNDEFVSRMAVINPEIEIISSYKKMSQKIECRCKIDNHEWAAFPENLLKGHGCPKCSAKACSERLLKSDEEFRREMAQINKNIEILSPYAGNNKKIKCRCKLDDYEWTPLPADLLRSKGCPKCKARKTSERCMKPHEVFVDEIYSINPSIEILGEYKGCEKKIKCRCKIDGHIWYPFACNLSKGEGCPVCGRKSQIAHATTSHEEFLSRMGKINPEIIILGEYKNNRSRIECKCKKCGHKWVPVAADLLSGSGCPSCRSSHGERAIAAYLSSKKIEYSVQKTFSDCKSQRKLPFDFYLPSLNACIEYDGEQHYRPVNFGGVDDEVAEERFTRTRTNDKIKNKYCQDHNIKLIRIPYWDFKDIALILDSKLIS